MNGRCSCMPRGSSMNTKRFLLALTLLAILSAMPAYSEEPVIGRVVAITGEAHAVAPGGVQRRLRLKSPIALNDKVLTEEGAKVQIMLADDSVVSAGENSEMVIDEYVYNPGKAKDNGFAMKIVKGVFRVITGKITELNPDRFRVKTRMATIGIRGCDLGFSVTDKGDDVYIIDIHGGEQRIIVVASPNVGAGEWQNLVEGKSPSSDVAETHLENVLRPNRIVSITVTGEMGQREMTSDELLLFLETVMIEHELVIPEDSGDQGSAEDGTADDGSADDGTADDGSADDGTADDGMTDDGTAGDDGAGDTGDPAVDGTGDTSTDGGTSPDAGGFVADTEPVIGGAGSDVPVLPPDSPPPELPAEDPPPEDPPPEDPPPDGTPPDGTPPGGTPPPQPVYVPKGGGALWSWGYWSLSSVPYDVDIQSAFNLSVGDFASIRDGSTIFYLTGNGDASAIITHAGSQELVMGFADAAKRAPNGVTGYGCILNVQIGNNATPSWGGQFLMDNSTGSALSFEIPGGTINSSGHLMGTPALYSMDVHATHFGLRDISSEAIDGTLLGPLGATVPAGAIGTFMFQHGGAATVDGIFGANLTP
ncbi:MAG: hypothetical protein E4H02_01310 [Lentisphaerales bacterium]|nr:MAG: hypothetical protein E4H02_01310 [Lentisphaerales bacterium]